MTQTIAALADVRDRYQALFVDLWGCLHNGQTAFPEAVAALREARAAGLRVVLVTNSPRPRASVMRQIARMGVPGDAWDEIASSGDSAQAGMVRGAVGRQVYHLGPETDAGFFTDLAPELAALPAIRRVPLDEAEGIVCTGPLDDANDRAEDYRPLLLAAKNRGLKLLCANPDLVVDRGHTRVLCAGAIAALYTEMGGESLYFGKPHPPIYDLARRRLTARFGEVPDTRILCIGDGMGTDIAGAIGEDLDSLFITGGLAAAETGTGASGQPDPARLAAFLARGRLSPTFAIGYLR